MLVGCCSVFKMSVIILDFSQFDELLVMSYSKD